MPKKPAKNSYFYFMLDFKHRAERNGQQYADLAEVAAAASDEWKSMDKSRRAKYEDRAKQERGRGSESNKKGSSGNGRESERYTSHGIAFSELDRLQQEEKRNQEYMKTRIKDFIEGLSYPDGMAQKELHFIMGNYFIKQNNEYLPAEVAIVKFSLAEGVIRKYHLLLSPENLPLGYAFEAKDHSNRTHRLPCPPNAMGEKNFRSVYNRIMDIVRPNMSNGLRDKPMMFVGPNDDGEENIPMIQSFLKQFSGDEQSGIDVFPMTRLFLEMKLKVAKNGKQNAIDNIHLARILLERNPFGIDRDISCKFHDDVDAAKYCALVTAMRWCFLLSDYLCDDVDVVRIAGKHLPRNADMEATCAAMNNMSINNDKMSTTASVIAITEYSSSILGSKNTTTQADATSTDSEIVSVPDSSQSLLSMASEEKYGLHPMINRIKNDVASWSRRPELAMIAAMNQPPSSVSSKGLSQPAKPKPVLARQYSGRGIVTPFPSDADSVSTRFRSMRYMK